MENYTLSGTAEFSEKDIEDLQKPLNFNEVKAKLSFTEEQVEMIILYLPLNI